MLALCALVAGVVRTSVSAEAEWHDEPSLERSVRAEEGALAGFLELADDLMTHEGPLWALLHDQPALAPEDWALVDGPLVGHAKKGWGGIPAGTEKFELPVKEVLTAQLRCRDVSPEREDAWHTIQNLNLRKNADIDLYTYSSGSEKQRVGSFASDQTHVIYEYEYSMNSKRPNGEPYVKGYSGTVEYYQAWKETVNCKELEVTFYQSQLLGGLFDAAPNSAAKTLNVLLGKRTYTNVEIPLTRGRKNLMLPFTQKCEVVHAFSKEPTMQAVGKKVVEPAHCAAGKRGAVVLSGEWRQTKDWTPEGVEADTKFIIGRVVWYLDK